MCELDFSPQWYQRRQWLQDAIAACVLVDPKSVPPKSFRDSLTDPDAKLLMALAASMPERRFVIEVHRELGARYLAGLLWMVTGQMPKVFRFRLPWYLHLYSEMQKDYRRYESAMRVLSQLFNKEHFNGDWKSL